MATLSNQGRTVPELPSLSSGNISNSDFLIIQNVASNSTKKSTVSDFCQKSADIITKFDNLNFTGPNNKFVGSITNYAADSYSIITQNVPNLLRRLKVTDYLEIGYNPTVATQLDIYSSIINVDQTVGTGISFTGNGTNSSINILNYPAGITLGNTPFSAEQITASYTPYGFLGNIKGNVTGDINSSGTSNFNDVEINSNLTANSAILNTVSISGGDIDNTNIGQYTPSLITGTVISAVTNFIGSLDGNVTGDITSLGTSDFQTVNINTQLNATNISSNNIVGKLTGNLTGSIRGDVFSNNGTKILENGTGGVATSFFYGTSSYSRNGTKFSSFSSSYAFSSSHAKSSSFSNTAKYSLNCGLVNADTADFLNWNSVTSNGTASYSYFGQGKYSSFSSSYTLSASKAVSSSYGHRSFSASYALRALTVGGTVDNALYAISAGNADSSLTSSYLLQTSQNTSNTIGYFDGTRLKSAEHLYYYPYSNYTNRLLLSSSINKNYIEIYSRGYSGLNEAGIALVNKNDSNSYPDQDSWNIFCNGSGSLTFNAPIGSWQFNGPGRKSYVKNGYEVYGMVQKENGFYFWPYMSNNTPARDGAIGIGVQPTSYGVSDLKAKLHINCFSGSGEGPWTPKATVENRATAILVQYGSASAVTSPYTTFYVSASGNTYVGGTLTVYQKAKLSGSFTGSFFGGSKGFKTLNNRKVSFWGTGSYSVSSSYSARSTLADNATYATSAGTATTAGALSSYYGQQSNFSFSVINPTGAITYGKYLFYTNYNYGNNLWTLKRLDQETGEIITIYKSSTGGLQLQNGGKMSIHRFDYQNPPSGIPNGISDRLIFGYDKYNGSGGIFILSNLDDETTPVYNIIQINNNNSDLRCLAVDGSGANPVFYFWPCGFDTANDQYNLNYTNINGYKIELVSSAWTRSSWGQSLNFSTTYATNIVNYNYWLNVESQFPAYSTNIISVNYNPLKKYFYIIGDGTGLCNVFKLTYGTNTNPGNNNPAADLNTWFNLPSTSADKYTYLTYVKSLVVPTGDAFYNPDVSDYAALEYNTDTTATGDNYGKELFWTTARWGTSNTRPGSIIKSRFWGTLPPLPPP